MLTYTLPYRETENLEFECPFFAIHNPLYARAERKDFPIVDTQDDGSGNTQVNVTGTLPSLTVGGTVFINAGTFGSGLCTNALVLSSTSSAIVIDVPFTGAFTGGYVNLITDRANYAVFTKLQCSPPTILGTFGTVEYIERKDYLDNLGNGDIDIAESMRTKFRSQTPYDYASVNRKDFNHCVLFSIEVLEVWDGSTNDFQAAQIVYAVDAAMQIQHEGGSCMVEHCTVSDDDVSLFLKDAERINYYKFLHVPIDIQFLLSLELYQYLQDNTGSTLVFHEEEFAGNSPLSIINNSFNEAIGPDSFYQRLVSSQYTSYSSGTTDVLMWVGLHLGPSTTVITEKLRVRLKEAPCNPVFLRWRNSRGGFHYFCFGCKQLIGKKTTSLGEFTKSFTDLQEQNTTSQFLGKDIEPYMVAGSDRLDEYEVQLMDSLSSSTFVEILYNLEEYIANVGVGQKWREVNVEVGEYKMRNTKKTYNPFEVKIRMPGEFTQRN